MTTSTRGLPDAAVAALDPKLRVEWVAGVCVIHGPKSLPAAVEVQAMRLVEQFTPQFVVRLDDN